MEADRINEIALILARKAILDTKIPATGTDAFNKWVTDSAKDLDISNEEFAAFVQIILRQAVEGVAAALDKFKTKKKNPIGFV